MCTTKVADLAVLDNNPHTCNTWAGACLIGPETTAVEHGTFRAGLLWQPVLVLTNFHCRRVTSWSFFLEYRRIKLHDRQLGGLYQQKTDCL